MSRPLKVNPDTLSVQGKEVPSIGEHHFQNPDVLRHVDDPELRAKIVESDDESEPTRPREENSLLDSLPGGSKVQYILSGLSVDETRLSALIICLLISIIFGGVVYILYGDISANLTTVITTLIYAIAGVNISNSVINHFTSNRPNTPPPPATPPRGK